MQIAKQFLPCSSQNHHADTEEEYGQVHSFRVGECLPRRLSESCANLLSRTASNEISREFRARGLCSPQVQRRSNRNELENLQVSQGARSTSLASLTSNSYTSPTSGNSTPTSSGESGACSLTAYIATAVQSTDNSVSSALAVTATSTAGRNQDKYTPNKTLPNGESAVQEAAPMPEGLSTDVSAGDEDEGICPPREIHPVDIQLARMLAAVSQAANVSPAQLVQILLNFAPEDYQDLVHSLVESGGSCVHLLACHLHNLRTMAEEAIDDSLPTAATATADGKEVINAPVGVDGSGNGIGVGSAQTAVAKPSSKPSPADSNAVKKGKATDSPMPVGREVEPEDKAYEALRASIMDQYCLVVSRLMHTALGLLNTNTQAASVTAQTPPPRPQNGRGGGSGSGRSRAEQLSRSRSVPSPLSTAIQVPPPPPPPPPPGGHGQRTTAQGATVCSNPTVSADVATPRAAGSSSAAPRSTLGTPSPACSAFSPSASASGVARAATMHGYTIGNAKQVSCQRLRSVPATFVTVEALGVQGLSTAVPGKQLLAESSLSTRDRSLSQAAELLPAHYALPAAGAGARRGQRAHVGSYVIDGEEPRVPQVLPISTGGQSAGKLAGTHAVLATQLRGTAVRSLPTQRIPTSYPSPEQSHIAASLLHQHQQQVQIHQQLLLQQQLQLQQQQQQHRHQQQIQSLYDQQLQQLELLELLAASNGERSAHDVPLGMAVLSSRDVTPSVLAPAEVDVLGVAAAAAQLMQTYSGTSTLTEPAVWPSVDPLAALQWQLPAAVPPQNSLGLPGALPPQINVLANQQHKQQLLLMAQGGLLPTGTAGGHTATKMTYGGAPSLPTVQLPGGWMM